jgi:hypothetical protein
VISDQDAAVLEGILRREGRSLLQYISEAFPWIAAGTDETLTKLQQLTRAERDTVTAVGRFLARQRRTVPFLGAFPMTFFSMNFVSLDYLLPRLVETERQALALLEGDRSVLRDAAAVAEVDQTLAQKRQHLHILEALTATPAAAK